MPVKKEIVYPIFLECCQYTTDIFWENVFEDLAYAKTPYGTYISKDFLSCSYKKREFSYKIENKPAKQIYDEVSKLLINKLGLLSQNEKVNKKIEFSNAENSRKINRKSWSDIKKKNLKELLIELYVIRMKNKHSLSLQETRYLLSIISFAMVFKVITTEDIDYRNDKIYNIVGIDFINRKVVVKRNLYDINVSFNSSIVEDKKLMTKHWEKFLEDLRKISVINNNIDHEIELE